MPVDYSGGDPRKHEGDNGKNETGRREKLIKGLSMSWLPLLGRGTPSDWGPSEELC